MLAATVIACWVWPTDTPSYRPLAGPGHGRGMSQVGAFDSAREGWAAERILDHYYPGATLGKIPATTVGVRLVEQDDSSLDAYADAGLRVAGQLLSPGQVAHLTALPDGGANVVVTMGCDGGVLWQRTVADPWIYPLNPRPNRPAAEHLTLCGGSAYRGSLGVAMDNGEARTVNRVDIEDYLVGLVPAEVQANWADKGATEGLRAQAIAARSYALAEHRYPYAQTCDTTDCQVYPGTAKEDPRATQAIAATAGTVLLRDGRILRAEYSAAPDGGEPADIYAFDVGPTPAELGTPVVGAAIPPIDPRKQTLVVESPIDAEYRRIGGANSALGQPLGPEMALSENVGTYRLFANGVIIATPTLGARVVDFTTLMQLMPDPHGTTNHEGKPGGKVPPAGTVPQGSAVRPSTNGAPGTAPLPGGSVSPGAMPGGVLGSESPVPAGVLGSQGAALPGGSVSPERAMPGGVLGPESPVPAGVLGPQGVAPPGSSVSPGAMPGGAFGPESPVPAGVLAPQGAVLPGDSALPDGAMPGGVLGPESPVPAGVLAPQGAVPPPGDSALPDGAMPGGVLGSESPVPAGVLAPQGAVPPGDSALPDGAMPGGVLGSESPVPAGVLGPQGAALPGGSVSPEGGVLGGVLGQQSAALPGGSASPDGAVPGGAADSRVLQRQGVS
ncbi:SpoIID/LytB domain-containing protein [Nocardia sp. CA-129566]|uniref:SpoIID/LytB domain-containing protein n=1 Tax=Nocardia sp. CA-129566 TaxID=3239976 RepID=UPI003D99B257